MVPVTKVGYTVLRVTGRKFVGVLLTITTVPPLDSKLVPVMVKKTLLLDAPEPGTNDVTVGAGSTLTVNALSLEVVPPSTVVTLIFQEFRVAAYGMVTLPMICVGVILNIVGFITLTVPNPPVLWLRNVTLVPTGSKFVPGRVKATVVFWYPDAGEMVPITGAGYGLTANAADLLLNPPPFVTTYSV